MSLPSVPSRYLALCAVLCSETTTQSLAPAVGVLLAEHRKPFTPYTYLAILCGLPVAGISVGLIWTLPAYRTLFPFFYVGLTQLTVCGAAYSTYEYQLRLQRQCMGWYWNLLRSWLITAATITTNAVHYEKNMLSEGLMLSVNLLFCYLPTVSICHKIHKIFQGLQPRMATMARESSGNTPGCGLSHSVHSAGASSQRTLTSSSHGGELDVYEYV